MMRGSASVKPGDIVNGSREATLGLLWSAFLQFQASWLELCFKHCLATIAGGCHNSEHATSHRHRSFCCSSILCCVTLCCLCL